MWIFRIFVLLCFIGTFVNAQIPEFENNYSKNDSIHNKDLIDFSKKFDFILSYHKAGYWFGNKNYYKIIALNKKEWQVWESYDKNEIIRFKKVKKQPSSEKYNELLYYFNANKIWEIDNSELNTYKKSYSITDDGDTIFKKRDVVADASTTHLNFISKNKLKTLGLYSSDINSDSSNRFYKAERFYENWWERVVNLIQK